MGEVGGKIEWQDSDVWCRLLSSWGFELKELMNDINDIILKSSGSVSFFYFFLLPFLIASVTPIAWRSPAPDQDGTKYGSDPKVSPRGACGPFGIQYNHIMFGLSPAHPRVLGGASWRCGGLPWLVHESSHGIIYIYIIYIYIIFIYPRWSFCYRMRYLKAGTEWFLATILCKKLTLVEAIL